MNTVLSLLCEGFLLSVRMGMYAVAISVPALLLSLLFRRLRAPQWVSFLLWGMIAFRLVCPLALPSSLSVFNLGFLQDYASRVPEAFRNGRVGEYSVAVDLPGGREVFDAVVAAGVQPDTTEYGWRTVAYTEDGEGNIRPAPRAYDVYLPVIACIWVTGAAAFLLYGVLSYLRLLHRLRFAVRESEGGHTLWLSDRVKTPCLVGILRPRIVLPFGMEGEQRQFVLCHEEEHLRHGDHIVKLFCYLLLCAYWYNYLIWILYSAFLEELELACDARVLQRLGPQVKAEYSGALLEFSVRRRMVSALQIAFGENHTKERVKAVLRWKPSLKWLAVPAMVLCLGLGMTLLTDARDNAGLLRGRWFGAVYEEYAGQAAGEFSGECFHIDDGLILYRSEGRFPWVRLGELAEVKDKKRLGSRDDFATLFADGYDSGALYDQMDAAYQVAVSEKDAMAFWLVIRTTDGRVLLLREDGYYSAAAHVSALYRLDTGWYMPPELPDLPVGKYTATALIYWAPWSSLSPDYAWGQAADLRFVVEEDAFSVTCTGEVPPEMRNHMPLILENIHYTMEEQAQEVPAMDGGEQSLLSVPEGFSAYLWRACDAGEEESGWRLLWNNGSLYAGYWRPFGEKNQTMACVCLFLLQPVN